MLNSADQIRHAVWYRLVKGLHSGESPYLLPPAQDFLNRQDFRTEDPKELGIRAALIDLGFLQADEIGRVTRKRAPMPLRAGPPAKLYKDAAELMRKRLVR